MANIYSGMTTNRHLLKFVLALAFPALLGLSQSVEAQQGVTEEQAAANRAQPYNDGMEALANFTNNHQCDGADAAKVEENIGKLGEQVKDFSSLAQYGLMREFEQEQNMHTSLSFAFADEALKAKCLDQADQVYRNLIQVYVGEAYSGIRDRAKLGVDDVRAARK